MTRPAAPLEPNDQPSGVKVRIDGPHALADAESCPVIHADQIFFSRSTRRKVRVLFLGLPVDRAA